MADVDRNIIEIVVQGAEQAVRRVEAVSQSQSQLAVVTESSGVRQRAAYDSVARAAEAAAQAQERAAKRAEETIKRSEETKTKTIVDEAAKQAQARRAAGEAAVERVRQIGASGALGGVTERLQRPTAGIDNQSIRAGVAASQQARAALVAQQAAAQTLQGKLQALGQTVTGLASNMLTLGRGSDQATEALNRQGAASQSTGSRGITYLSVLSAIHAASFLATNQTFSMIGSFATLTAAFGKLGLAASVGGAAFGALLAIFGNIQQTAAQVQQVFLQVAQGGLQLAAGVTAGIVAAGTAATKIAADVETQLAAVRAFGGASVEQLRTVAAQASELSVRFGVAAADVVKATSLFVRAGGSVKEATDGATEAIIRLQVASQGELDAAQSAILLSAAMRQFNLDGTQAGRVADALAGAFQASALSAIGVQQAFVQAAPGAAALGITIDDLASGVALLGDQLVKGSLTGTTFKQFILDTVNPTRQAKAALAEYGISLQDSQGRALPFLDALEALNKGLGDAAIGSSEAAKAERARVLAVVFGSRAFLAANILTREGVQGLEEYRQKLEAVTTNNIVDVLLLPMNAQLQRLQRVIEDTGNAFGGSLLPQAKTAIVGAISFIQQLRPAAELAGQAVGVILANQGFGALQDKIREVAGEGALSEFLINLVNSVRNVRDVIVNSIVPALQGFGATLAQTFEQLSGRDTIGSTFNRIDIAVRNLGTTIAVIIGRVANLTREFILNEGVGGRLRQQLANIATAIATRVVIAFQTMIVSVGAAIALMPILATVSLKAAEFIVSLVNVVNGLRLAFSRNADSILNTIDVLDSLGRASRGQIDSIAGLQERIEARNKEGDKLRDSIVQESQALNSIVTVTSELLPQLDALVAGTHKVIGESNDAATAIGTLFEQLEGDLPDPFANLAEETETARRELERSFSGTTPGVPEVDTKALDRARERVREAASDVARRLANIGEDAAQRTANNIARALERLDDIKTNALDRITELNRALEDRIADQRRQLSERREDRGDVDAFKKEQDDRFTIFQRRIDRGATADQRELDRKRRDRQRDEDDFQRSTENIFQDSENLRQRQVAAEQRAFDQIQQIRELAFDRAQAAELSAFQRSQEAAAEARNFSLQLAQAKTPEDRTKLTLDRQQALQNTKFQQGQEDALTKFRLNQEDKKRRFSQQLELQGIKFREAQEDSFTKFRRKQEENLLSFKRSRENQEQTLRDAEEDAALGRRLAREDRLQERREQDAIKLQAFQDKIEDQRAAEAEKRDRTKALVEAQKIIAAAEKQAQEVIDSATLQANEQAAEVDKQLRNVIQTLEDLKDQVPPEVLGGLLAEIDKATAAADTLRASLALKREQGLATLDAQRILNNERLRLAGAPQTTGQPTTPLEVVAVQTIQAANVVLPAGFTTGVAQAVLLGIQQASEQGIIPDFNVDLTTIEDGVESIRRAFRA